ncbi:MAG: exo-alpha-sialidase [Siphonobacter aquaeclarae]|nr:exo-alpha-sialidase [Siphonobacter aquaeclarae]
MKTRLFLSLLLSAGILHAQTPVFTSGSDGYKSFRIPAVVRTPKGELLAFAEGRVGGAGDFGDIDLVLKRSSDDGKTWSSLEKIVDNGKLQAGNPAPVIDETDPAFPGGRLFLFYNTGNNHEGEVRKGKGLREVWVVTSADGGRTWSVPENITAQVHRPKQEPYSFPDDWRSYANTPGHAVQVPAGKYRGRIFVAANHSAGDPRPHFTDYRAHGYYSDDHGKTYHLAETVAFDGSNEATAAWLPDGGLLFNARNQSGTPKARIVARSRDGGATWSSVQIDPSLPDPVCEGSLLNLRRRRGHILAFCNAADTTRRDRLTLRLSKDGGISWTTGIVVDSGPDDFTAYSDLTELDRRRIGVLYERENYRQIVFKVIEL